MRERLRNYEFMFIISPIRSNEEDVQAVVQRIGQTVESAGGEVTSVNYTAPWGRRRLAYPIRAYAGGEASRRNFTEGFYVLMHFSLASQRVVEVERTAKLTDTILRYLVTTVDGTRSHAPHEHDTETNGQENLERLEEYGEDRSQSRSQSQSQSRSETISSKTRLEAKDDEDEDEDDEDYDEDEEDEDEEDDEEREKDDD
ncbi:MAG: 30S ribosomal protein S6, partial [Chloroflexaceae bacterium]|nr:30S ribosomal protein S6 [Chloroflexaceae bacterium]